VEMNLQRPINVIRKNGFRRRTVVFALALMADFFSLPVLFIVYSGITNLAETSVKSCKIKRRRSSYEISCVNYDINMVKLFYKIVQIS
jgi:hypothetical protein